MKIEFEDSYDSISEAELVLFEKELGARLPDDYRNFLLAHNGGTPTLCGFDVKMDDFIGDMSVRKFLGLKEGERYSFSRYLKTYKGRLPENFLPIATVPSVDLICLSVSGEDYGKVYFWDHNWEITDRKPDYSNVYFVASSFSDFLDMLYSLEEDD